MDKGAKNQSSHPFGLQNNNNKNNGEQSNKHAMKEQKDSKGTKNKLNKSSNKKNPRGESLNKTPRDGGHKRMGKHKRDQQKLNSNFGTSVNENLDLSIQEEIMGGNFKMRGNKAQVLINHLLDFNLPEVERNVDANSRRRHSNKKKNYEDEHINLVGDSFINVNYRLLLMENEDYSEQINDPNCIISDDKIVSIVVPTGQQCPICLCEKPVAPRMVGCGHIFCYTCLLNFFSVDNTIKDKNAGQVKKKKYIECPLCNNIVRPQRVKHVVYLEDSTLYIKDELVPKPGIQIKLDLMFRENASILALPIDLYRNITKVDNIPSINDISKAKYSRLIKCDPSCQLKLLNDDIEAIQVQHEIDKALYNDDNDQKFVNMAVEQINNTVVSILDENQDSLSSNFKKISIENQKNDNRTSMVIDDNSGYFFYQTSHNTSTKYFLSPLDIKILLAIFEKYSRFPSTLEVEVENVHYGTVITERLIRRYKYMGHFPLGTEIAFIDINWKKMQILTDEIYEKFKRELKQRHRELNIKRQREDRNKKLYEAKLEEEIMEFYRSQNGESYLTPEQTEDYKKLLKSGARLETLWSKTVDDSNQNNLLNKKKKAYKQNTVWGTSISVIPDEKTYKENEEFAAMLLQKMRESGHNTDDNETNGSNILDRETDGANSNQNHRNQPGQGVQSGMRKNKKKGKVVLFST